MFNCTRALYNVTNLTLFLRNNRENAVKILSTNIVLPTREKHGIRKIKVHDNYWVPRRRALTDDKLTEENKAFLQDVIEERFLKPGESPLKENQEVERAKWTPESVRVGVIARKIGAYPMWKKNGEKVYTTLLQVVDNHVIRYNPPEIFSQSKYYSNTSNKNRTYGSLVVGAENADPQLFTAAYNGLFAEAGVMPKKKLTRFRITPDAKIEPGTPLFANHFRVGDHVNVRGITRYQGFQGVMKRYGFKGGPKTHGCTKSHRRPGCIGGGRGRGVWKGKKMPGLMGGRYRLHVGLKVWRINTKYNVIYVHGSGVPGGINSYCTIYDSYVTKKHHTEESPPPFPTFYPEDVSEPLPENTFDKDLHTFSEPSVIIEEEETKAKS
ncbi:39S ribosomal protein L3, mitochondrial-like [Uloborus diversus]|uniref:39S ribosomal protein L3, mitochondrial-like n=1 Tax=Uloborus diversus TaxID=327109 RepID=UPI00240A40D8|nr:39S ribosomal protein L3, mitochondrial-like [Uloborus diversus]